MKEKTGSKHTDPEDAALVEMALKDNSQAAFFALYTRYHAGVKAHIAKYVQEPEEIEDICMESFEKAFKQLHTYNKENRFSTWIFTIARNTAFDHKSKEKIRGQKIEKTSLDDTILEQIDVPSDSISPEEEIILGQDHENLLTCIGGLPDLYREVAVLCFIDNLGYKEIAEKTGLPIGTVKTRISRGKARLEQMMLDKEK